MDFLKLSVHPLHPFFHSKNVHAAVNKTRKDKICFLQDRLFKKKKVWLIRTLLCGKPFFSNTRRNGEWTETCTRQNELELAMFGKYIFFKLANKYQINNTVMFNNLFCRFWQVINLVKKDQHSLKSCVDLFFLKFVVFVF